MIILILFFAVMTAAFVHEYRKGPTPSSAFYIALYIAGLITVAMFTSLGIIDSLYFLLMMLLPIPSVVTVIVIIKTGQMLRKSAGARKTSVPTIKQPVQSTATPRLTRQQVTIQKQRKTISRNITHFSREASLWVLYLQHDEEAFWSRYEQILASAKQQRKPSVPMAG